jgi:hypothetical protein
MEYTATGNGFMLNNTATSGGSRCLDGGGGSGAGESGPFVYLNDCYAIGTNSWQTWTPTGYSSSGINLKCSNAAYNYCLNDAVNYHTPLSTCLALNFTT